MKKSSANERNSGGQISSGCLVRHVFPTGRCYLIVHPSGNYNRYAPWSIPKGLVEPNELIETCALRETQEETGLSCRILKSLGKVHYQKSRKIIFAFLAEPVSVMTETTLNPASWEVDGVEFFPPRTTRTKLHPDQKVLIDRAEGWSRNQSCLRGRSCSS